MNNTEIVEKHLNEAKELLTDTNFSVPCFQNNYEKYIAWFNEQTKGGDIESIVIRGIGTY